MKNGAEWDQIVTEPSAAQEAIADCITEEEVRGAIRACKSGKAAGPDRQGNGWYRNYGELLVPILKTLLKIWYGAAMKGGSSSNALNVMPLALLNTDSKIYTRILASRVGIALPENIYPNQTGFVPGQTIHKTGSVHCRSKFVGRRPRPAGCNGITA